MYTSNLNKVTAGIRTKLQALQQNPDPMLRTVALAILPEVKRRVHVEGRDSSGGAIGTYTPSYMQVRTGNYRNSDKVSRGANKGKLKNAGTVSRGERAGTARPKYNRTGDTKVILSLTRQMENDMSVIASGNGYGIGYNNKDNYQKSQWNEATYKKSIWKLTKEEKQLAVTIAQQYIKDFLNNK